MPNKTTNAGTDPFLDEDLELNIGDDDILDLSEVPDSAGFELWPAGVYDAVIDDVEFGRSQRSNNPMLTWHLKATNAEGKERTFWYFTTLDQKGLPRTKRAIVRVAPDTDLKNFKPSQAGSLFAGKRCQVRVKVQTYEGERRNTAADILPPREGVDTFLDA